MDQNSALAALRQHGFDPTAIGEIQGVGTPVAKKAGVGFLTCLLIGLALPLLVVFVSHFGFAIPIDRSLWRLYLHSHMHTADWQILLRLLFVNFLVVALAWAGTFFVVHVRVLSLGISLLSYAGLLGLIGLVAAPGCFLSVALLLVVPLVLCEILLFRPRK